MQLKNEISIHMSGGSASEPQSQHPGYFMCIVDPFARWRDTLLQSLNPAALFSTQPRPISKPPSRVRPPPAPESEPFSLFSTPIVNRSQKIKQ